MLSSDLKESSVFIESGAFDSYGGWVLDTQFIPNMGSAYLLAHGLGEAVADAVTTVTFPQKGEYNMWAFTRDWVAPWKTGVAPGLFKVLVNGAESDVVFGSENADWHWQYGGKIVVEDANAEVRMRDFTGFEGRFAALFFTSKEGVAPPDDITELAAFRRYLCGNDKEEQAGKYDLVVAGGGIAGICAALSAARQGLTVAFIQDRPVVGGNNSSEVRVWLGGETNFEPFPHVGDIVAELKQEHEEHYGSDNRAELYEDERKLGLLEQEKNVTLFMEHALVDAEMDGGLIKAALICDVKSGAYKRVEGSLFLDSTGDGILGAAAKADFEMTTNGHMGMTNVWHVVDTGAPQTFVKCPWAIDLSGCKFPGRADTANLYGQKNGEKSFGCWYWESGCEHDPIEKAEYARDTNFRSMYGAWDCVKNVDGDFVNYKLGNCAYIGGKRESRRFFGDVVLTKSEVYSGKVYEDGCVPSTWNFDVHYPDRKFYPAFHEGDAFLTQDYHEQFNKPYFVPYRCFYSRNVGNLFLAGRNVSVSHDALGTVRVMRTGGMMGEVVGKAAAVCKNHGALPRDVYEKYLEEFLSLCGKQF